MKNHKYCHCPKDCDLRDLNNGIVRSRMVWVVNPWRIQCAALGRMFQKHGSVEYQINTQDISFKSAQIF